MSAIDVAAVSAIMREVAAEEILPRFRTLDDDEIRKKEKGGLVTTADYESERRLGAALAALLPGSAILGEEAADDDPELYRCLLAEAPVWVIDPLDGTKNFAAGKPDYAVIVALVVGGMVRAGWILAPETGVLVCAEEGAGSWADGERLEIGPADEIPDALRGSLGRRLRESDGVADIFAAVAPAGSCGIEYMRIARGTLAFAHYRGLKPWDHAAGDLIVREAGGAVAALDGTLYDTTAPHRHGLLSAASAACWDKVAGVIRPVLEKKS